MNSWYLLDESTGPPRPSGPFTLDELRAMAASGALRGEGLAQPAVRIRDLGRDRGAVDQVQRLAEGWLRPALAAACTRAVGPAEQREEALRP